MVAGKLLAAKCLCVWFCGRGYVNVGCKKDLCLGLNEGSIEAVGKLGVDFEVFLDSVSNGFVKLLILEELVFRV
jgi:hypothetical protein